MDVFFLKGRRGALHAIYHAAAHRDRPPLGLVYVPPFAEEMNRSRRMAALQARRLAAIGIDVLLLDLFGTGDSAGDFSEASWQGWREDVVEAAAWLAQRTEGRVGLWGLRLGAMLSADIAAQEAGRFVRMLFWQPILSGERYLTQFLRLRLAATMGSEAARETTKELRERLRQGEPLEIAGYHLSSELAHAILSLNLQPLVERARAARLDWLEITSDDSPSLQDASRNLVDVLAKQGCSVNAQAVQGEQFWAIQEITLTPNLLGATEDALRHES